MVSAVTVPPRASRIRSAASTAFMSNGLMIAGTPSRIMVLVTGSHLACPVSGTCFTQTTIFIVPPSAGRRIP